MKPPHFLYTNVIQYAVIILGLLSGLAFYPGYIALEKNSIPWFVHLHTFLMVTWMIMLVVQAYLVRKKNNAVHRVIGKVSYFIVPVLLMLIVMLLQHSYDNNVASFIRRSVPEAEAISRARAFLAIPFFYLVGFVIFYSMAIANRRNPVKHGQYMVATALMLTGPVFDRILYIYGLPAGLPGAVLWELVGFLTIDLIIIWVAIHAWRNRLSLQPAFVALSYFFVGQLLFIFARKSDVWHSLMGYLFT